MRIGTITQTHEGRILLFLLLLAPFLLTPWVHGDGIGHFVFLRSAVIDGDLDLENEFAYLTTHIREDAGGLPGHLLEHSAHQPGYHPGYHLPDPDPATGRVPSNWSVGPALFWAPAYLAAHGLVQLENLLGYAHRTDGYGGLYYLALALTTLACGVAGVLLAYRLAARIVPPREACWAAGTIVVATSLLYYLYLGPSHSHALTTLTSGALLLHWHTHRAQQRAKVWFVWGLLAGLLFLVRWNDIVIALPIFALESVRAWRRPQRADATNRRGRFRAWLGLLAVAAIGVLLVAAVQLAVWQHLHGRPWVRHSVDTLQFTPAGLWGTLFSWRHGLFTWTPVTVLAVAGLFRVLRRDAELGGVSLAVVGMLVLSNCTVHDWWAGTAFGMRRLVSAAPVFVVGLATLCADARAHWFVRVRWFAPRRRPARLPSPGRERPQIDTPTAPSATPAPRAAFLAPLVFLLFGAWNVLLMAQFALGMISHVERVPFATIVTNQAKVIARLIELAREILG